MTRYIDQLKQCGVLCSHSLSICPECNHDSTPTHQIFFFPNGNTMVFDTEGKQIPDLQRPWLIKYVEYLEEKGIDPLKVAFTMPDGISVRLFKTSDGYSWCLLD